MNALKFYVPPKGGITLNFIQRCIERKLASTGRMDMLENYYKGNQLITERIVASSSTPDNKVEGEDDIDIAKVILNISTGAAKTYFALTNIHPHQIKHLKNQQI